MSFVVRTTRHAEHDLAEAARWYEEHEPGLGSDFLDEVDAAVLSLSTNALLHAIKFHDARRVLLRRFKTYAAYFVIRGEHVIVFAVVDGRRNPEWIQRRREMLD